MASLARGRVRKAPPPPEKGCQPMGFRLHAGPPRCPLSFVYFSLFRFSARQQLSPGSHSIRLVGEKLKRNEMHLRECLEELPGHPGIVNGLLLGSWWLSIIYWTLIMFLAPPRQKRDKVPSLGASQGRKGQFWQLKKCSIWKDSDTSQLKAALCLYYLFIFNDVRLFSYPKVIESL